MTEIGSEGLQPPAKPGIVDRVVGLFKGVKDVYSIDTKPVPVEEITPGRVAQLIDKRLRNPIREGVGQSPFINGFNMTDLLDKMNYTKTFVSEDLRARFPEAYDKSQAALAELEKRGVVEFMRDEEGNVVRYKVRDSAKLNEIASKVKGS